MRYVVRRSQGGSWSECFFACCIKQVTVTCLGIPRYPQSSQEAPSQATTVPDGVKASDIRPHVESTSETREI